MHEILCFGDSNTWGYSPAGDGRFPRTVRWTGVLQAELGDTARVIEEGLNGRTTVDELLSAQSVAGMELYPVAAAAPIELQRAAGNGWCGILAIWSGNRQ